MNFLSLLHKGPLMQNWDDRLILTFFSGSNLARDGLCGLSRRRKRFVQRGLRGTFNGKFLKNWHFWTKIVHNFVFF